MVYSELIDLIQKKDTSAKKHWFDTFYSRFSAIAFRYTKNAEQAEAMLQPAMHKCYEKLQNGKDSNEASMEHTVIRYFISECVGFVKNVRSEYYVSSTVNATAEDKDKNYNLFENDERPDLESAATDTILNGLRSLVPAQRLIFNLHVIDGYTLAEAAEILESSEPAVKSNLEKARFNLQKNVEKSFKTAKS